MPDISAAIRNAVSEKIVEIQRLADQLEDILYQAGLAQRRGRQGIRLRRDNWVSVRYAEELNSGQSSVLLQRADRHGILGQKPPDFQVSL
jgi:hypothetical protein